MAHRLGDNEHIAESLERVAGLLQTVGRDAPQVGSYRRAARAVRSTKKNLALLYEREGREGLQKLRSIGPKLAGTIGEIIETGRLELLDELEREVSPPNMFARVPGIGPKLAKRIQLQLHVNSLEQLEKAADEGKLQRVEGVGSTRARSVRDALARILSRLAKHGARRPLESLDRHPPLELLLQLDAEYREKVASGRLHPHAPRRSAPEREVGPPILEAKREGWSLTVLFSSTARAREMGKTKDWVVIYYRKDDCEDQCTVLTAVKGLLAGKRIVSGRERECRDYYHSHS